MFRLALLSAAALLCGIVLAGCGSGSSSTPPSPTAAPKTTAAHTALPTANSSTATGGGAKCPTVAEVNKALGGSYSGPTQTNAAGIGIVCEYTGGSSAENAGVTIFAREPQAVFDGQVSNAGRSQGMTKVSGVGDGAFGLNTGGRSVVNAWSNSTRTFVAAQASASLAQTEALAKVALADN